MQEINLDAVKIRRAKEDRGRGQEDELIFEMVLQLQNENVQLKAELEALKNPKH